MHQSIFITLLLVSLCYTAPPEVKNSNSTEVPQIQENNTNKETKTESLITTPNGTAKENTKEPKPLDTSDNLSNGKSNDTTLTPTKVITTDDPKVKNETTIVPPTTQNITEPDTNNTTTEPDTNNTATEPITSNPTIPSSSTDATSPPMPQTSSPSSAPIVTTTATPTKGRTFDGASFLGGMILSFGMVAIGILGFRYYKSHSEQNYHTL